MGKVTTVEDVLDAQERREASEKDVQRACDELVRTVAGGHAWVVVQTNPPHRMMQSKGVPDRRYRAFGTCFFFELKAPDGKLSQEQHDFLIAELDHECLAACGGVAELKKVLEAIRADRGKLRSAVAIQTCRAIIGAWAERGFRGGTTRRNLPGERAK